MVNTIIIADCRLKIVDFGGPIRLRSGQAPTAATTVRAHRHSELDALYCGTRNGANGMSDIEGKATRVGASERGQRTSFNGANGMSDIEGKATRVGASERWQRTSFNGANGMSDMHGKATRAVESEAGAERMNADWGRQASRLLFHSQPGRLCSD